MAVPDDSLPGIFRDLVALLEERGIAYLIIGGVAQAVIGEPRVTQDVDCLVAVEPTELTPLVEGLQAAGFTADLQAVRERVDTAGTFSVTRGRWRVDLIVASTAFERSAFQRAMRLRLYETEARFPTPEDLILLKVVPGREKDLLDAKTVMVRHRERLDVAYVTQWAQRLADEAEDPRIWQTVQRLLKDTSGGGE